MSAALATDDNSVPPLMGQHLKYAGFTRFELELEVCQFRFITCSAPAKNDPMLTIYSTVCSMPGKSLVHELPRHSKAL